jgi:hypothetical protein
MEMSQGNFLYSYLKHTRIPFFSENQRTGVWNRFCHGGWYQWEEAGCGERV